MEIFAYRPAPVVMHYMGFGATIGASYVDYFLSDLVRTNTIFSENACELTFLYIICVHAHARFHAFMCLCMYLRTVSS